MVGFTIRLDKRGDPTACEVTNSSGSRALDDENLAFARNRIEQIVAIGRHAFEADMWHDLHLI